MVLGVASCGVASTTSGQLANQVGFFLSAAWVVESELKTNAITAITERAYLFIEQV
jgi:hypothetical protein